MSTDELNVIYSMVNGLLDDYLVKWKIDPLKLKRYLKLGTDRYEKFKRRNNLNDIKNIDAIITDLIDDRCSMPMLFESIKSFNSIEDCILSGLEKPDVYSEKELSSVYKVNVGDIDVINSKIHLFRINDWDNTIDVTILSFDEFELIRLNLRDFLYHKLSNYSITIPNALKIDLKGLIDINSYKNRSDEFIDEEFTIKMIESNLNCKFKIKTNSYFVFES